MKGTFEELIDSDTPVLIDFFAEWCGPCKAMSPALQQLAEHYGDKLRIVKVDIDRNVALQRKFRITGVPTIMVFKNSKQLFRKSGAMMFPQLKDAVKAYV